VFDLNSFAICLLYGFMNFDPLYLFRGSLHPCLCVQCSFLVIWNTWWAEAVGVAGLLYSALVCVGWEGECPS